MVDLFVSEGGCRYLLKESFDLQADAEAEAFALVTKLDRTKCLVVNHRTQVHKYIFEG
ncbi:hypothetical protein HCJ13_13940 [Listeria booriae]|uniref:hypothetical protein n=2 Tax=Listeria booriae TaxID=1552123 RepID=UPI001628A19C|nr:hypothetical protein [Listeria booriae]MBC1651293.1 hypothetical protein [Listeria booriae]MBC2149519.1 hypothetical protein [Listeria booriae]